MDMSLAVYFLSVESSEGKTVSLTQSAAHMQKLGIQVSSDHNLLEAVRHQQHWMLDFHIGCPIFV